MKKLALALILAMAFSCHAQTVTLKGAATFQVSLTWTQSTSCTTSTPCLYTPERITGSCPATLVGSTGWTVLPATTQQATTATDTTVVAGQTYSYVVEAAFVSSPSANSDPSNCITLVVPTIPAPPSGVAGSVN